jgi:hypothetical protein
MGKDFLKSRRDREHAETRVTEEVRRESEHLSNPSKPQLQTSGNEMTANEIQVGGTHYKKGGEEHWDRAWRLHYDSFQYIITKWVERWRDKGGVEDLRKAQHAIAKYIELVEAETENKSIEWVCPECREQVIAYSLEGAKSSHTCGDPDRNYVNQDR